MGPGVESQPTLCGASPHEVPLAARSLVAEPLLRSLAGQGAVLPCGRRRSGPAACRVVGYGRGGGCWRCGHPDSAVRWRRDGRHRTPRAFAPLRSLRCCRGLWAYRATLARLAPWAANPHTPTASQAARSVEPWAIDTPEPGLLIDQFHLRGYVQQLGPVAVLQRPIELTLLLRDFWKRRPEQIAANR